MAETEANFKSDRDSTRWKMEESETNSRRETFWELYTYDSWQVSHRLLIFQMILTNRLKLNQCLFCNSQCLTFGRPPSFSLPHVDCKFPYPADDPTGERSCKRAAYLQLKDYNQDNWFFFSLLSRYMETPLFC